MDIRKWLHRAYRAYRKQKTWQQAVRAMAMVVVFCTTYALILPAITVETDTICGMTPHSHSEECYETVVIMDCTLPESEGHTHSEECYEEVKTQTCQLPEVEAHKHTEQCYVQETVCGQEAQPAHVHSEDCKGTVETLICADTSEEHEHVGTCYVYEEGLICGQEETEGHTHTEDCWESRLNCGQEETEGHTHTDTCFAVSKNLACGLEESEAHSHTTTVLICGLEEHVHDETCYPETEPETTIAATLPEGDPQADLETAEDWETSFAMLELTGDWSEDLIAVAKTQLGYTESSKNYIYDENNQAKGYTRYGQWGSDPYADWSAMFASFCLHYAGVDGIAPEQDCQLWLEELNEAEIYREAAQYIPVPGDLIFLDRDADEICDHVAIVEAVDAATEEKPSAVHLIAGDWENRVDRCELSLDAEMILGYALLPTEPEEEPADPTETTQATEPTDPTQSTEETEPTDPTESTEVTESTEPPVHTHSGEDGTQIQVQLPEDTAVPADADLTVTEVTETDEQYAAMTEQVRSLVEEDIVSISLLDISFYDSEGAYIHVPDTASVTITLKDAEVVPGERKVFHFVDGVPVELEKVSVNSVATVAEDGTESMQTCLTFETEGFSVFAVVEVVGAYEQVDLTDLAQLDDNSFYIISNSKNKGMLASLNTLGYGLAKTDVTVPTDIGTSSLWTFDKQEDGTYLIHSGDSYLIMQAAENGLAHLKITDQASATYFTVGICDDDAGIGQVVISYTDGGATYYLNQYQGDNGPGFYGWHDPPYNGGDAGSKNYLYRNTAASDTTIPVTDLGGKSFAIVNPHTNKAMTTIADVEVGTTYSALHSAPVTIVQIDGVNYYTSTENVPLWTFAAVPDSPGVYTISATVGTETLYLNMTTEQRGHLTLSSTPQNLTVTALANGKVLIGNGSTYLNSSGSDTTNDFWCYNGTGNNSQQLLCLPAPVDSSFTITYDNSTITVSLVDSNGDPLYADRTDYPMNADDTLLFSEIAPPIEGYVFSKAVFSGYEVASVESNVDTWDFRLYRSDYTEGSGLYYSKNEEIAVTFVYRPTLLNYNLNRPTEHWFANTAGWDVSNPTIGDTGSTTTASQEIPSETEGQTLYSVSGRNACLGKFISFNTYMREYVSNYFNDCNIALYNAGKLTEDNYLPPGAEWVFLGWKATVGGNEYLFSEGASVYLNADGSYSIEDVDGIIQTVPAGTTLDGQWKMVSNVVMFFVNHGDTMLEDEDNIVVKETGSSYYTNAVAIGHIYNPPEKEIYAGDYDKSTIQRSLHDIIEGQFVPSYDSNSMETQLVIDAIGTPNAGTNPSYTAVSNYNEKLLEEATSNFIQNDTNKKILLDNAELDKHSIIPDNYKLYWYSQKLVSSEYKPYHIDGVLVAKTQPMEIYKTFSGLTNDQADAAIAQMTFPLHLVSQVTLDGAEVDKKNAYTTLQAADSQSGVYTFDGRQTKGNIFKWTLESVQGQRYTFEEEGYDVTGYDCSSLVSVHYADGAVVYKYNTDATYTDLSTGTANTITDLFASKPLVGGEVESVIFANFYTPTGTGMFSISKVADAEGKIRLPGAKFALYTQTTSDGTVTEVLYDLNGDGTANESDYVTTNENGAVHFSNLPAGTYILKEESPPSGYQSVTTTWTVEVSVDNKSTEDTTDDSVIVTIKETGSTTNAVTIYDRLNGGIQDNGVYLIQNTPVNTTVTVNKYFKNISSEEIEWLESYYTIEVKDANGNAVTDSKNDPIALTLKNGSSITGTMNGFTWIIDLPCGTEAAPEKYIFEEIYFSHKNYLDTIVTATVNGEQMAVSKGTGTVMVSEDGGTTPVATVVPTASFTMTKTQAADTVNITNDYSNTFDLQIHKVDATNGNANMEGVEFNIYGDFEFHKKPTNGAADTIAYTADDGTSKTAWYIGTTAATDANGLTLFADMKLSSGSNTFLYVIDEANTPAGYVKLDEPIVKVVEVSGDGYFNGVYTLQVENYQEAQATVTVTATKQWDIPEDMTLDKNQTVTLTLYKMVRNKADESAQITDTVTAVETVKLNAEDGWTKTWTGLPYAEGNVRNEYFIAETPIDGFNTSYSTTVSNLTVGSSKIDAAKADGYELKRSVVVTNSTGFELPSTGGVGEPVFVFLGLMLILAGGLYWLEAKKKTVRGRE